MKMEKRYQIFARVGVRNVATFNARPKNKPLKETEPELPLTSKKEKVEPGAEGFAVEVDEAIVVPREEDIVIPEKLSYIVVIIDELADLMRRVAPADVEMALSPGIITPDGARGGHPLHRRRPSEPERGRHHRCHQGEHHSRALLSSALRAWTRASILDAMAHLTSAPSPCAATCFICRRARRN